MQKAKKLLALSLSLSIMLSVLTAVISTSAFAADSYSITANNPQGLFADVSDNYKAGDEFDLNVFVEADELILSGAANIKFNSSALFVTSAKKGSGVNGSFFAAGTNSATYQKKNNLIAINFSCGLDAADFTTEALLFTVHFKVKDEIAENQIINVDISTLDGIEDPYDINTGFPYIDNNAVVKSGITARAELTDNSAPPTTAAPTTETPTTQAPTTQAPTTQPPTTQAPTTQPTTTQPPTTQPPTTQPPTTQAPTTQPPTTQPPTTQAPTTQPPTTQAPTTQPPTTQPPTTQAPTTQPPTTQAPTTQPPTTQAVTTQAQTTAIPTTVAPTTAVPTTVNPEFYTFYFQPSLYQEENNCNYKLYFKDLNGNNPENTHRYTFTKTPIKQGDTYYYRVSVPKYYDDVAELHYQIYIGNTWISQISFDRVKLSDFDNIIIKNDDYEIAFPTEEPTTDALQTTAFTTQAPATEVVTTAAPTTIPVTEATEAVTTKASETETVEEVTTKAAETETKEEATTEAFETETNEDTTAQTPSTEATEETKEPETTETTETEAPSTEETTSEPTEKETASAPEQTSSPSSDTKTFYYLPSQEQIEAGYIFKITIQDNKGNYNTYDLSATDDSINGINIYKAETDASVQITAIYYQVFEDDKWVSHINVSPDTAESNIIQYDGTAATVEPDTTKEAETTAAVEETTTVTEETTAPQTQETTAVPAKTTKKPNPIKVSVKTKTIKAKKLKKKAQKIKPLTVKNAKGKVTYKLIKKGSYKKLFKKAKINSKGVISIKKLKLKKGKYKLKVRITAKGDSLYQKKTLTKTVKIKVK